MIFAKLSISPSRKLDKNLCIEILEKTFVSLSCDKERS